MAEPVLGGWDSIENFLAAVARGETAAIGPAGFTGAKTDTYIEQQGLTLPPGTGSSGTGSVFTAYSSGFGNMINPLFAGVWSGFDPNDIAGGLAIIKAYSLEVYGSVDLGTVRYSSEVLENEPTGVRPGQLERIVIPAWARRERGSPL